MILLLSNDISCIQKNCPDIMLGFSEHDLYILTKDIGKVFELILKINISITWKFIDVVFF